MQNKSTNRWLDVQIVIATLTLTFSLALWNLFAGGSRTVSTGANLTSQSVASPPPASAPLLVASPPPASAPLPQVRIYLGGAAPQSLSILSAPEPVTNTSSSRP